VTPLPERSNPCPSLTLFAYNPGVFLVVALDFPPPLRIFCSPPLPREIPGGLLFPYCLLFPALPPLFSLPDSLPDAPLPTVSRRSLFLVRPALPLIPSVLFSFPVSLRTHPLLFFFSPFAADFGDKLSRLFFCPPGGSRPCVLSKPFIPLRTSQQPTGSPPLPIRFFPNVLFSAGLRHQFSLAFLIGSPEGLCPSGCIPFRLKFFFVLIVSYFSIGGRHLKTS